MAQFIQDGENTRTTPWFKDINRQQWKALLASSLGWMLDAMDVMLYSMVLIYIMEDIHMSQTIGGLLATLTLLSSAIGGLLFGVFADRFGRIKSLMFSIAVYSLFTFLCGFSQTITQLAVFRILLGLGMGGEWVAGAALVTETWPAKHRGKAMGIVQSNWAIGYAIAAVISGIVIPLAGWRGVFFFGAIPAVVVFLIRKGTDEPELWQAMKKKKAVQQEKRSSFFKLYKKGIKKWTIIGSLLSIAAQFGYWGLFTWIPAFLSTPVDKGGAGLDILKSTTWIVVMQAGAWLGYTSFGFLADRFGRKITFVVFFTLSAVLVPFYGLTRDPTILLIMGPFVSFFGSGYFSGFGTVLAELFPTDIRATAQGFCYNFGRGVAAFAPFTVGVLATSVGLGAAFGITSVAFALAAFLVILFLPETKGKQLTDVLED